MFNDEKQPCSEYLGGEDYREREMDIQKVGRSLAYLQNGKLTAMPGLWFRRAVIQEDVPNCQGEITLCLTSQGNFIIFHLFLLVFI